MEFLVAFGSDVPLTVAASWCGVIGLVGGPDGKDHIGQVDFTSPAFAGITDSSFEFLTGSFAGDAHGYDDMKRL